MAPKDPLAPPSVPPAGSPNWRNVRALTRACGAHRGFQLLADLAFSDKYKPRASDRIRATEILLQYAYGKPLERSLVVQADVRADHAEVLPELDTKALVALGRTLHQKGLLTPAATPAEEVIDAQPVDLVEDSMSGVGDSQLPGPPNAAEPLDNAGGSDPGPDEQATDNTEGDE